MAKRYVSYHGKEYNLEKSIAIVVIALLLFLIFYFITFSWFGESRDADNVITIGNISIDVNANLNFTGVVLEPNRIYDKSTTITGSAQNTNDALVRAKIETDLRVGGNSIIVPVFSTANTANWIEGEGGWFYFVGLVNNTTTITFNNQLRVITDLNNTHARQPVQVTLTVYAIQAEFGAHLNHEDWANAPAAWRTAINAILNPSNP